MSEQTKNSKTITLLILAIVALLAAVGVWYFNYASEDSSSNSTESSQSVASAGAQSIEDGKKVSYDGIDGQSALALLKQYADVQTEEFAGIGEYVVSINGVAADSTNNFWAFYVNDQQAQVGAGDYITESSDKIEWRLEDVEAFEE